MIRLFAVEVRRILSRRLVRMVVLLAILAIAVSGAIVTAKSHKLSAEEVGRRATDSQQLYESCISGQSKVGSDTPPDIPQAERERSCRDFSDQSIRSGTYHLTSLRILLFVTTGLFGIFGWLIGATFIGGEWHHRSLTTQLTWETRRWRLILVKWAALAVVVFLGAIALHAILVGVFALVAHLRGDISGTDAAWYRSLAAVALRSSTLSVILATIGFGLATIGRNTAAALGIGFAYIVIAEQILANIRPLWRKWLIIGNSVVFISGQNSGGQVDGRSTGVAIGILTAYSLGLLLVGALLFRTRDVA